MVTALATKGLLVIIGIALIGAVVVFFLAGYHVLRATVTDIYHNAIARYTMYKYQRNLCRFYAKRIRENRHDYLIHLVFGTFSMFYEQHFHLEKAWELNRATFPDGVNELTTKYLWIKNIREENYNLVESLSFDLSRGKTYVHGHCYPDFSYSIDRNGRLYINPCSEVVPLTFEEFLTKKNRIHVRLIELDNELCAWIVENRKHFAF